MSAPAVSVIVPTHRRPDDLRRCLNALAALELPAGGAEVVVVDDGTPGGVGDVRWARAEMPLRLIRQANAGPAAARNRGAQAAVGIILAFTDDDCVPDPSWLTRLIEPLVGRPDAVVGGRTRPLVDEPWLQTSEAIVHYLRTAHRVDEHSRLVPSNSLACRRDRYLDLGGFDTSFPTAAGEDREFVARWQRNGGAVVIVDDAEVAHGHRLTALSFWKQHHQYGRGSARARHRSQGERPAPLRLLASLVLHPLRPSTATADWVARCSAPQRIRFSVRILIAQLAVASGFAVEHGARVFRRVAR